MTTLTVATRAARASLKVHVTPLYAERPLRVLCATDLWARSDHAVQRALSLVKAADAHVMLLHVVEGEAPLRILGRRADRAQSALEWRVRQWRRIDGALEISVRIGKPHRMIARVARDWSADLIVLGAYRARAADAWLGTTAERLAHAIDCGVLVVNDDAQHAYSNVALVADSTERTAELRRVMDELNLAHATARTTSFRAAVRSSIDTPPDLIVVSADRRPLLARIFRRSMTNTAIRSAASDVLICPRRVPQHVARLRIRGSEPSSATPKPAA